jgi:uncharacterized protein involved in exopolysaccharide biosynthesis/cellulose biosynthesis protein BcsQ
MKLIDFIKLLLKHKVILIVIPILFGLLTVILTNNPTRKYYSQTVLYTGIASGSSIDMNKKFNYLATNNAFDNLINIIKSRDTQEEVAIRLLTQHIMLNGSYEGYLSKDAYEELLEIIPKEIQQYIVKTSKKAEQILSSDSNKIPWNEEDYEATVANLMELMTKDNSNFVYSLLNFDNPYYSLEAIAKVKAERMSTSDLVKLSYETDDPGICQQTLEIYNSVCIKKYKDIKENGSDAVVKYFEIQLKQSEEKLRAIEQKLLKFNQDNYIINYYEQSKAVAIVKEDMSLAYKNGVAQLAGSKASIKRLEGKLKIQEQIQKKNQRIIDAKKRLGQLNYEIGMYETKSYKNGKLLTKIKELKQEVIRLDKQIKTNVNELYTFQNTTDGVPIKKVLPDWIDKVVETEDLQAKLKIMNRQTQEIEKQFATYAPAGANLKRIERQIEVAEQGYLEILHGLNLAKLKYQDTQLSTNLKAVDPPFYPLKPIPSKRKIIIIAIVFISGIFLLAIILFMKFFDNTLKNEEIAKEKLQISSLGMLPKIFKQKNQFDLMNIQNRLMDFVMHNFNQVFADFDHQKRPKIVTVFSTKAYEGKTTIVANIAEKLKRSGKNVLVLNHSDLQFCKDSSGDKAWLYRFFGYQDPRVDHSHLFLANIPQYLQGSIHRIYKKNANYHNTRSFEDLDFDALDLHGQTLDYVFIELPNVLETHYPIELISNSDLALLVCRSNRLWSAADENILNNIKKSVGDKVKFIINGVEIEEVEALLGELPKSRSNSRRKLKNILRFQFYSHNHI